MVKRLNAHKKANTHIMIMHYQTVLLLEKKFLNDINAKTEHNLQ